MKKIAIFIIITWGMQACSGYFNHHTASGDQSQLLATVDGGSLSLPGSDEITPFLFRNTNGANPVLFYASDKGGDFDIYYAIMNDDGIFSVPQALGADINTTNDEKFPIISWFYNGELLTYELYLLFSRESNGNEYLVSATLLDDVDFQIDPQAYYAVDPLTNNVSGISLEVDSSSMYINISLGTNYYLSYYYSGDYIDWAYPGVYTDESIEKIYDVCSYYNYDYSPFETQILLYSQGGADHNQFYLNASVVDYTSQPAMTNSTYAMTPEVFSSTSDDRYPFVDWFDPDQEGKIYFSSDRDGNGDYDLYRYNINTINELLEFYPIGQYYSNFLIGSQIQG